MMLVYVLLLLCEERKKERKKGRKKERKKERKKGRNIVF